MASLLWVDVVVGEVLSWMAVTSSDGDLEPDVHLELAELHGLLSKNCRRTGFHWLARLLAARSAAHWALGGGDDLPPAVAMAMPVPDDVALDARLPDGRPFTRTEEDTEVDDLSELTPELAGGK